MKCTGNSPSDPPADRKALKAVPLVDVRELMAGSQEVRLVHNGTEYRLRVTRQGKLLLTK